MLLQDQMFVDIKIDEYLSLSPPNVTRCLLQIDRRRVGRGPTPGTRR